MFNDDSNLYEQNSKGMKRNIIISLCIIIILPSVISLYSYAQNPIIQQLQQQKQRLKNLEEEIHQKTIKKQQLKNTEISILERLKEIDTKIQQLQQQLELTKKKWTQLDLNIIKCNQKIKKDQQQLKQLKALYIKRIKALYEMGEIGSLNILLSAQSLTAFINRFNSLKFIITSNKKLANKYQQQLARLKHDQAILHNETQKLAELTKKIQQETIDLESEQQDKKSFLQDIKTQEKEYDLMLAELKKAELPLKAIITKLQQSVNYVKEVKKEGPNSFVAQKGKLFPPVNGEIEIPPKSMGVKGIIIVAPWGSEIRATFGGKIIYKDIIKGYGPLMIIDHGDHYYTLIAQAVKFFKNVGDRVKQGDILGLVGGGPWAQSGIYFEIRHGNKPLDPLTWFDPSSIKLIKHK